MASKQETTDQNSKISTDCPTLGSEASKTVLDEAVDALEFIPGRPMMPNASKLKQMGQSFNSVIGQLTSLSRGSTLVTSPTTPLSPHSEQLIQNLNEEPEEEEFKSLLHKKLHERNLSLQKDIHKKVTDNYTKVPQKLSDIRQNLTTSEANFQETLMALQQANHHCSETFWNMDDSINIANSITFPNN